MPFVAEAACLARARRATTSAWVLGVAVSSALASFGCLGPPPRSPPGPESELTIENRTSDELCGVHLMPSSDERGFGPNRMEKHETVAKGGKRRFGISETKWNVRVKDCLGRTVYQRLALPLGKEPIVVVTEADADALLVAGEKYAH